MLVIKDVMMYMENVGSSNKNVGVTYFQACLHSHW